MKKLLQPNFVIPGLIILLLFFFTLNACKKKDEVDNEPTSGEIVSGEWSANTGFGKLEFEVNSASTHVTEIELDFNNWTIGISTFNNSITYSSTPGWAITNRQFSFTKNINPFPPGSQEIVINGTFSVAGNTASGTWSANFDGLTDSGNWSGVPSN